MTRFQDALEYRPDDPGILLCLARASHQMENYWLASKSYDRVKELDPELAERFAYLDLRGDDAARAAHRGGLSEVTVWIEEDAE